MRRFARRLLESLRPSQVLDPATCQMASEVHRAALIRELADVAEAFFSVQRDLPRAVSAYDALVEEFFSIYVARPFRANQGGSGFHNAFWLFLFARTLAPVLIVESGVWKGHTSWLLRKACPNAVIHCFDLDLSRLETDSSTASFHGADWASYEFGDVDPSRAMVFFDCHVNHAHRIVEAKSKGFRHLIFDDDPPAHKLYGYGLPGVPTARMIADWDGGALGPISWTWLGKERSYEFDAADIERAKRLIACRHEFPDVGARTRFGGFSFLSYVRLQ